MLENKSILRVFPEKTAYTPEDSLVYIANHQLTIPFLNLFPSYDEIHISALFTWDKKYCEDLAYQFKMLQKKPVYLGGPAFLTKASEFTPGLYTKKGIIFTSRGCNNACPWCIVPTIEGKIKELPIHHGRVIQDNNFLQTSQKHQTLVFEMLKKEAQICFKGGLEASRVTDWFVEAVRGLRIKELWLACDSKEDLKDFKIACEKLKKVGFTRRQLHCYALIGDGREENEGRLREIWECGAMPFAQLYREFTDTKTAYSVDWNRFARQWQRPAAIKSHMKKGTNYLDYDI